MQRKSLRQQASQKGVIHPADDHSRFFAGNQSCQMKNSRRRPDARMHTQSFEPRMLTCQQPVAIRNIDQGNNQNGLGRGAGEPGEHRLRAGIGHIVRDHMHDHCETGPFAENTRSTLIQRLFVWRDENPDSVYGNPVPAVLGLRISCSRGSLAITVQRIKAEQEAL